MAPQDAVYCTLLLSDNYLPGAMVLAHSLRDNGTTAKLVALYTPETLQPATVTELQTIYDTLIAVPPIPNTTTPANLWLIDRPDLITTFTKIELWRQTQFRRIVYIDCDVVALRAPDELLDNDDDDDDDVHFAAAPDVGWPDCFNSGVMVLRPNLQDYNALRALAEKGVSFDGADQGLLNMHFNNADADAVGRCGWHRLGFGYNCTPSANYQYLPAFKHYGGSISLVHFIGGQKPWDLPREVVPRESPYNELLGRWWGVYDRHYRGIGVEVESVPVPGSSQDHGQDYQIRGTTESQEQVAEMAPALPTELPGSESLSTGEIDVHDYPKQPYHVHDTTTSNPATLPCGPGSISIQTDPEDHTETATAATTKQELSRSVVPQYVRGEEHVSYIQPVQSPVSHTGEQQEPRSDTILTQPQPEMVSEVLPQKETESESKPDSDPGTRAPSPVFEPPMAEWDASREPPPQNTKPEAIALHQQTYSMSSDTRLFQPPESYPEAPRDMYYAVPSAKPEPEKMGKVFPWEGRVGRPTRVFPESTNTSNHGHGHEHEQITASPGSEEEKEEENAEKSETETLASWKPPSPSMPEEKEEEKPTPSFENYTHSNAWDQVPEIQQYIVSIQKARDAKRSQGPSGAGTPISLSTPSTSTPSVAGRGSNLRFGDLGLLSRASSLSASLSSVSSSDNKDEGSENERNTPANTTATEPPPDLIQDEWTSLTTDGFVRLLQFMYLYCTFTTTTEGTGASSTPRGDLV